MFCNPLDVCVIDFKVEKYTDILHHKIEVILKYFKQMIRKCNDFLPSLLLGFVYLKPFPFACRNLCECFFSQTSLSSCFYQLIDDQLSS